MGLHYFSFDVIGWTIFPAGTQRPKDFPLWSYFGRDVPGHNKTKIGRIRFLTSQERHGAGVTLGSFRTFLGCFSKTESMCNN